MIMNFWADTTIVILTGGKRGQGILTARFLQHLESVGSNRRVVYVQTGTAAALRTAFLLLDGLGSSYSYGIDISVPLVPTIPHDICLT
jgi:hypothetical protein